MSSCPAAKECGLHSGNIKKADGTTEERKAERDLWSDASAVAALDKAAVEKLAGGARDKDTLLVLYAPWCPFCQVGSGPWVFCCCVCWGVGADMPILTCICVFSRYNPLWRCYMVALLNDWAGPTIKDDAPAPRSAVLLCLLTLTLHEFSDGPRATVTLLTSACVSTPASFSLSPRAWRQTTRRWRSSLPAAT